MKNFKEIFNKYSPYIIQLYFVIALVPMYFQEGAPTLYTSIPTGIGLMVLGFTAYKDKRVGMLAVLNGLVWLGLAIKRISV